MLLFGLQGQNHFYDNTRTILLWHPHSYQYTGDTEAVKRTQLSSVNADINEIF